LLCGIAPAVAASEEWSEETLMRVVEEVDDGERMAMVQFSRPHISGLSRKSTHPQRLINATIVSAPDNRHQFKDITIYRSVYFYTTTIFSQAQYGDGMAMHTDNC